MTDDHVFSVMQGIATKHRCIDNTPTTACGVVYVEAEDNLHADHDLAFEVECETCFPASSIAAAVEAVGVHEAETAEAADAQRTSAVAFAKKRESETSSAMAELVGALEKAMGRSRSRHGDVATLRAVCLLFAHNPTLLWGDDATLKKACEITDACRNKLLASIRKYGGGPEAIDKMPPVEAQVAREYMDVCSGFQVLMDKAKAIADQMMPKKPSRGLILPASFRG